LDPYIESAFNFEIELKNIILVGLRAFEFSHSLGPGLPKSGGAASQQLLAAQRLWRQRSRKSSQ
jgi:hypothetical protein